MRQRGKHARPNGDGVVKKLLAALLVLLLTVQLFMLNEQVRGKLSIVDMLEGQRMEFDKNNFNVKEVHQ